jgi:hypothetical protein
MPASTPGPERTAVVIPVYNHGSTVKSVIRKTMNLSLRVIA